MATGEPMAASGAGKDCGLSHTRFELGFPRHRKVFRLSDAAYRLWTSAIDYAREQRTNGRIDKIDLAAIPRGNGSGTWKTAQADELVKSGLWEKAEGGGWQIHDFLDWQDSDQEANAKREQARERMRRVRANRKGTSGEVTLTDRSPDPDHPSISVGSDLETGSTDQAGSPGARSPEMLISAAKLWISDPNQAQLTAPKPENWPETKRHVAKLRAVWGGTPQAPRHASDPRMKTLLERWAEGRTTDEIDQAIAGSKLDENIAKHPQFQTLNTILRDSGQVDKFIRLLTIQPAPAPRSTDGRAADGLDRQVAKARALRDLEVENEPKALA